MSACVRASRCGGILSVSWSKCVVGPVVVCEFSECGHITGLKLRIASLTRYKAVPEVLASICYLNNTLQSASWTGKKAMYVQVVHGSAVTLSYASCRAGPHLVTCAYRFFRLARNSMRLYVSE